MTSKNIKEAQILVTLDNGKHLLTRTDNPIVIAVIGGYCKFIEINEDAIGTCNLKEIARHED